MPDVHADVARRGGAGEGGGGSSRGAPASAFGGYMQYVQLDVVRYAAAFLTAADGTGQTISCEVGPHDEPATYLIPDATRPGGGGRDVEQRPAMVCREHM